MEKTNTNKQKIINDKEFGYRKQARKIYVLFIMYKWVGAKSW